MWDVVNENGIIQSFITELEADTYAETCNRTWQSCGFHVKKQTVASEQE